MFLCCTPSQKSTVRQLDQLAGPRVVTARKEILDVTGSDTSFWIPPRQAVLSCGVEVFAVAKEFAGRPSEFHVPTTSQNAT
jgi:hypothetical protein